jgi:hypothetical protein
MMKHWTRLWASVIGTWNPSHPGFTRGGERKAPYKGYWFELGHSLKNVPVEYLRHWNIWDRKG